MKKLNQPNPQKAKQRLLKAIQNNEAADWLLYETLKNASVTIGPVTVQVWANLNDNLRQYTEVWLTLTSPEGRKYIRNQLDNILNYIEYLVTHPDQPQATK